LPAGKVDRQLIAQVDEVEPFQNFFSPSLKLALLPLYSLPAEPGVK
jgi:hypothetical protein